MPSSNFEWKVNSIFHQTADRNFFKIRAKEITIQEAYSFLCEYANSQISEDLADNIFIGTSYTLIEQMKDYAKEIFEGVPDKEKVEDIIKYVADCCMFQFINEYDEDHITNCGNSLVLNFDPKIYYLLNRHNPNDRIFFTLFSDKIVIRLDEIIHQCTIRECLTKKHLMFTFDFTLGHELSHIKSGKYNSQYEYIEKHWNAALRLYDGESDVFEQQADKEGLIHCIKNRRGKW